jgi:mono/diheme cytochrome c family protein
MLKGPMVRGAFTAAWLTALSACAATSAHVDRMPSPAGRGHEVARRVCAACHAVETTGVSPIAAAPAFASLEMRHTASLESRVADLTRLGHYDMPPLKLRPNEVRDLVSYIASLEGR